MRARLLRAIVIAFALCLLLAPSVSVLAQGGRSFSRCVQACNAIREVCLERCNESCLAQFPGNPDGFLACVTSCEAVCLANDDECKFLCKAFKDPIPLEP